MLLLCLALLGLIPAGVAAAAEGAEEGAAEGAATTSTPTVTYTPESYSVYKQQLAAGQIKSVTINKRLRSLRVTLKDGRTVLAKYGKKERPQAEAALRAAHVKFAILTATQAKQEAKKPAKHKLRYIAGGILLVVIIVVGAVVLIRRRRARADY
jgi:ATP-dependent Zn protease